MLEGRSAAEELPPSAHLYTDMYGCGFRRNASGPRDSELVVLVYTWALSPSDTGITLWDLLPAHPHPHPDLAVLGCKGGSF